MESTALITIYDSGGETTIRLVLGAEGVLPLSLSSRGRGSLPQPEPTGGRGPSSDEGQTRAVGIQQVSVPGQGMVQTNRAGAAAEGGESTLASGVETGIGTRTETVAKIRVNKSGAVLSAMSGYTVRPLPMGETPTDGKSAASFPLDVSRQSFYRIEPAGRHFAGEEAPDRRSCLLYIRPSEPGAKRYGKIAFGSRRIVSFGSAPQTDFRYQHPLVSPVSFTLQAQGPAFALQTQAAADLVTVNGKPVPHQTAVRLSVGDVVSLLDMRIGIGSRFISINHPAQLAISDQNPDLRPLTHEGILATSPIVSSQDGSAATGRHGQASSEGEEAAGDQGDFFPAPRLMRTIHRRNFTLDPPPAKEGEKTSPAIMQLGPSFLMGIASVFMVFSSVSRLQSGDSIMTVMPTIAMAVAMVAGMVIWPIISNFYDKHRRKRDEEKRVNRYSDYLNRVEMEMRKESRVQADILRENRVSPVTVMQRALDQSPELMNRGPAHADFMELRLGIGQEELQADLRYPEERFTLDSDILADRVARMRKNKPVVSSVPLAIDLKKDRVSGLVGPQALLWPVMRGLIVQLSGLYSYNEVKIICIVNPQDEGEWGFVRRLPHVFSDDRQTRLIASTPEDMIQIDRFLQKLYDERSSQHLMNGQTYPGTQYVVFCADRELLSRSPALDKWSQGGKSLGVSLIFSGRSIRDLPNACTSVITVADPESSLPSTYVRRDDVEGSSQSFACDIMVSVDDAERYASALSGVRLKKSQTEIANSFPSSLSYMGMQKVGNTSDLNIAGRWREHDASRTLATQIGVDAQGQPFILDLHEDSHGPHGLIAGTTGSGKSELIITYILSLSLDYAPDEVSFVLIDYKGGGLAGAFDNSRYRLPHLAGTITNLDGSAINRSLVAIQSELKRRQLLFNQAREVTGEPTMDIYKYLSYFRQGIVTTPMPHLFIVADEFAELKQQEPEFMAELISAARIGRSLGVHLILATQKPSGVVNDQIWSNSRFKISLKVADGGDSKEMIRRPDAAELKNPGRFYLLVGYNDYFAQGQSAYTGTRYIPQEEFQERHDDMVSLIGNTAEPLAVLRLPSRKEESKQTELDAVLDKICETADDLGIHSRSLWLEPLPDRMTVDDFRRRFPHRTVDDPTTVVCQIGIVDDPSRQDQHPLSLDFAAIDSLIVYGQTSFGTESVVSAIFDVLIRDYGPDAVNLYAFDMGDGGLASFEKAPQVGGVALIDDKERVSSLMNYLSRVIRNRRLLLSSLGERYEDYLAEHRQGDSTPPMQRIIVALTNMVAFTEAYPQFADRLVDLVHEGPRYGVHFVVTSSGFNQVNWRLRALFGLSIVTAFASEDEYGSLLGSMSGTVPPRHYLRGLLMEKGEKHEFQVADAGSNHEIRERCQQLEGSWDGLRAAPIPHLPAVVSPDVFLTSGADLSPRRIPLGFDKQQVSPFLADGSKAPAFIVTGNDSEALADFGKGLCALYRSLSVKDGRQVLVVDPIKIIGQRSTRQASGLGGETSDPSGFQVANEMKDINEKIAKVLDGGLSPSAIVFTDIIQTLDRLSSETSGKLKSYIEGNEYRDTTNLIVLMERWRVESVYEPWMKALRANPQGLWIGEGIKQQSVFPNSNMPSEMNQAQTQTDGWVFYRGDRRPLRVLHLPTENAAPAVPGRPEGMEEES